MGRLNVDHVQQTLITINAPLFLGGITICTRKPYKGPSAALGDGWIHFRQALDAAHQGVLGTWRTQKNVFFFHLDR